MFLIIFFFFWQRCWIVHKEREFYFFFFNFVRGRAVPLVATRFMDHQPLAVMTLWCCRLELFGCWYGSFLLREETMNKEEENYSRRLERDASPSCCEHFCYIVVVSLSLVDRLSLLAVSSVKPSAASFGIHDRFHFSTPFQSNISSTFPFQWHFSKSHFSISFSLSLSRVI